MKIEINQILFETESFGIDRKWKCIVKGLLL